MLESILRACGGAHYLRLSAHAVIAAALVLSGSSCVGTQQPPATFPADSAETAPALELGSSLPPLPVDKATAATSVEFIQDGNDCIERDPDNFAQPDGLLLDCSPPAGAVAWAIYQFYCGSHHTANLTVRPQAAGRGIYIAYSDYTNGRWDFSGPYNVPALPDPPADISIPLERAVLSPLGYVYVAIVVAGDDAGAVIEELQLDVHNWQDGLMNLAAQNVTDFMLAEIGGRPAVAYVDTEGVLKFIRAAQPEGSSWDAPITVGEGPFGQFRSVSLAEIDGHPAIAVHYPVVNQGNLEFIRALDASGSNWPSSTTNVDSAANDFYCGTDSSLASINGFTVIAYRGDEAFVRYAVNNEDASGSWFALTVDDPSSGASLMTLREVNGHPAICYMGKDIGIGNPTLLQFAYSSSLNGINSLDWTVKTIDETQNAFGTGWLYMEWINDSYPAVIYPSNSGSKFKYAAATTPTGLDTWTIKEIDPKESSVGAGLLTDHGRPAVIYRDTDGMGFMRALDGQGANWAAPVIFAPISTGDWSVKVINGEPAIAYAANSGPNILAYTYRP